MTIQVFRTVRELREWRYSLSNTTKVGLVPTMGALHSGHLSLLNRSFLDSDYSVISIFVNPSQFAPHEDLDSYPRTWDSDYHLLTEFLLEHKNDDTYQSSKLVIFAPTTQEMYPTGIVLEPELQKGAFVNVLGPSAPLEGKSRPLFFRGVCTVVIKLLNCVLPTYAYFGQKDIQQCIVVQRMVKDLLLGVEIVIMPIIREENGLAKSSRNQYLTEEMKETCSLIHQSLMISLELFAKNPVESKVIIDLVTRFLNTEDSFEIDYVSVNDPIDLNERDGTILEGDILSLAVFVNQKDQRVRLIDNVIF